MEGEKEGRMMRDEIVRDGRATGLLVHKRDGERKRAKRRRGEVGKREREREKEKERK